MSGKISVGIIGASGRMGQANIRSVLATENLQLQAAVERPAHESIGQTLNEAFSIASDVVITELENTDLASLDVIVDFTAPAATLSLLEALEECRAAVVIGTTGFTESEESSIKAYAKKRVIIKSGNYSTGVNVLNALLERAAKSLDTTYNIEVIEAHHNQKVDAPSGTAMMLYHTACEARGYDKQKAYVPGREGQVGKRGEEEVGLHAVRGGSIIGEHTALFAGELEKIELKHTAFDRRAFSGGVVTATHWAASQTPGLYDMKDVLGLN